MALETSRERKIYFSATAPENSEWLWLQQKNGKSVLRDYVNGQWVTVGELSPSITPSVAPSNTGNYITRDLLTRTLASYVTSSSLAQTLASYAKSSEITSLQSSLESVMQRFGDYVTYSDLTATLNSYQKKLSVGTGLQMNSAGTKISVKCDATFNTESQNPISNAVVATKLALVDTAINNANTNIQALSTGKQDKLTAGSGITISGNVISSSGGSPDDDGNTYYSIAVVNDSSEATDENMAYFFAKAPLQGKGLFNTLLQNGSVVGTDGETYTYSPSVLYDVHPDGSFSIVEEDENHYTTVEDNIVFYNYVDENDDLQTVKTRMFNVGRVIVPHKMQYTALSDVARIPFQVSGPFFSETTEVTLTYDSSEVTVYLVTDVITYALNKKPSGASSAIKGYWPETELIESGHTFVFTNEDFNVPRRLIVKRNSLDTSTVLESEVVNSNTPSNTVDVVDPLDTTITFETSFETLDVLVRFGKTILLYKDGSVYNSNICPNLVTFLSSANTSSSATLRDDGKYFGLYPTKETDSYWGSKGFGMCVKDPEGVSPKPARHFPIVRNFKINQKERNIFYAKVVSAKADDLAPYGAMVLYGVRSGWTFPLKSTHPAYYWFNGGDSPFGGINNSVATYGMASMACTMKNFNSCGSAENESFGMDTDIVLDYLDFGYKTKGSYYYYITEIGITTYLPVKELEYDYQ